MCRVPETGETREHGGSTVSIWSEDHRWEQPMFLRCQQVERAGGVHIACVHVSVIADTKLHYQARIKRLGNQVPKQPQACAKYWKDQRIWNLATEGSASTSQLMDRLWNVGVSWETLCMASADKRTQLLHGSILYVCMYACIYTCICVYIYCVYINMYVYLCIFSTNGLSPWSARKGKRMSLLLLFIFASVLCFLPVLICLATSLRMYIGALCGWVSAGKTCSVSPVAGRGNEEPLSGCQIQQLLPASTWDRSILAQRDTKALLEHLYTCPAAYCRAYHCILCE